MQFLLRPLCFVPTDGVDVEVALISFTVGARRVRAAGITAVVAGAFSSSAGGECGQTSAGGHAATAAARLSAAAFVRGQEGGHGSRFVFVLHRYNVLLDSFEEGSLFSLDIIAGNVACKNGQSRKMRGVDFMDKNF